MTKLAAGTQVSWVSNKGKHREGVVKTSLDANGVEMAVVEMRVPSVVYKIPVEKLVVVVGVK